MKKIDSSFRTIGLIILFLILAMIQISYGIVMLSNQSGKAKFDVREKFTEGSKLQLLENKNDFPFSKTLKKEHTKTMVPTETFSK